MEGDLNQSITTLCRGGCGFYGSPSTDGLCSKCFKDVLQRKQMATNTSLQQMSPACDNDNQFKVSHEPKVKQSNFDEHLTFTQSTSSGTIESTTKDDWPANTLKLPTLQPACSSFELPQGNAANTGSSSDVSLHKSSSFPARAHNRCNQCRKKVGLTGFDCRCGLMFCGVHRYSDMHNCTFDYKSFGAEEIAKNNPVVKHEKVEKI